MPIMDPLVPPRSLGGRSGPGDASASRGTHRLLLSLAIVAIVVALAVALLLPSVPGPAPAPSASSGPPARVASPTYSVTFTESGIPIISPGAFWQVVLGGTAREGSTGAIVFSEPDGSYHFSASAAGYVASPASGTVTVQGASVSITIRFTTYVPAQYNVTWSESGLPPRTSWGIDFGGADFATSNATLTFTLENGTYSYQVVAPTGWNATPSTGTFAVAGAPVVLAIHFTPIPSPPPSGPGGWLGLPGEDGVYLVAGLVALAAAVGLVLFWGPRRTRRRRSAVAVAVPVIADRSERPGPKDASSAGPRPPPVEAGTAPRGDATFARYALMKLALIPVQLVFVLWLLYLAIEVPPQIATLTPASFLTGFGAMVTNIFTGNWGPSNTVFGLPWFTLYVDFLPTSLQVALFALPISAVLAYYLGLAVGWRRRPAADVPTRLTTLTVGIVPVFVMGFLVESAFFFLFVHAFNDIPGDGLIPSPAWFLTYGGGFPSWVFDGWITKPTGLPLIDGLIHHAWTFEAITLTKTLMQGIAVAIVYVAVFVRHARSIVASASQELHLQAARSRGIPEHRLLWTHTARRVAPSFLLLFALTIPAYLATQFVVEATFGDPGIGYLTLSTLANGNSLPALEGMIFLLAALVLVSVYVVDLYATRLDPRGAVAR